MKMTAEASVNGSEFYAADVSFDQTVNWVRSETAAKPDPSWEHIDSNRHFHAFAKDGKTPTLAEYTVHVDCDGSCGGVCEGEGYEQPAWKCLVCGEQVEPRFIPDEDARTIGVPIVTSQSATVTLTGTGPLPPVGQQDNGDGSLTLTSSPRQVSVRVRAAAGEMIGTGYADVSMSFSKGGAAWTVRVTGRLDPRLPQVDLEQVR